MIRRSTYFQLIAFAVISIVGIVYVGAAYVGLFRIHGPYTVKAFFPSSGGVFTNATVTERGVTVGKVSSLKLAPQGGPCDVTGGCIEVDLKINHGNNISRNGLRATIADLSAVGEQYVDLEPISTSGPFLKGGDSIPSTVATLPVDNNQVLTNLNKLLTSVNNKQLAVVIKELGKGFANLGPTLQRLIDNGDALTKSSIAALPQTLKLIDDGRTALDTQRDVSAQFKTFARTFASFSDQLRVSDPDLRQVLDNGVAASHQVQALLADNESILPALLSNLITFNHIQAIRLPQVRTVLEIYPADTAAGFHTTPGDGTAHFGQVMDNSNPCQTGYSSTRLRENIPSDWGGAANLNAYCHGKGITTDQRGSRLVPRPDKVQITNSSPFPAKHYNSSGSTAGSSSSSSLATNGTTSASNSGFTPDGDRIIQVPYDPRTGLLTGVDGNKYQLGFSGPTAPIFGSSSWEWLLLAPTMK